MKEPYFDKEKGVHYNKTSLNTISQKKNHVHVKKKEKEKLYLGQDQGIDPLKPKRHQNWIDERDPRSHRSFKIKIL